ncbi:MAG: F0F1 ATP synthase subunit delta, partial [Thermodesulfovibrionales bacterium]|nr:F0F1 ATP synthase subunit delta [Thermodesulfovibrionales bacterium]
MKKVKGVKKFAKQLLSKIDLADAPATIGQLNTVAIMMDKDRDFRNVLVSPVFTPDEVDKVISILGEKLKMNEKVVSYLKHIKEVGAIIALPEIVKAASLLYLEMKNRLKAIVMSPVDVSDENKKKLEETLKKVTGKETEIEYIKDTSLIGGVRIKLGLSLIHI